MLADHTWLLTPLTHKSADVDFPPWMIEHPTAFDAIKSLVISANCLTTIDHDNLGENQIFVTCDASDKRTGAVLSYGLMWESARPVAFDSMALKDAQLNYPVHKEELLAIIQALQCWRSDLFGTKFTIYTDHWTLENFNQQKDLSCSQACWQEFLAQYDHSIHYIPSEDNCIADSWLPDSVDQPTPTPAAAMLMVTTDPTQLQSILNGYQSDPFCSKLNNASISIDGIHWDNGLLYIGDRLVIPRMGSLCKDLFHLMHDNLGHFRFEKSYAALRDSYCITGPICTTTY